MVTDVLKYFLIGELFVLCHCYHGYWCFVFFTRKPVTCILSVLCKFEVFSTKRIVLCPVSVGLCADVTITDVLLFSLPGELFSVLLSLQVLVSQSGCRRVAVLPHTELQTRLPAAAVIVSFPTWSGLHLMAPPPHPTPLHHSTLLVNLDKNLYDCSALIFYESSSHIIYFR